MPVSAKPGSRSPKATGQMRFPHRLAERRMTSPDLRSRSPLGDIRSRSPNMRTRASFSVRPLFPPGPETAEQARQGSGSGKIPAEAHNLIQKCMDTFPSAMRINAAEEAITRALKNAGFTKDTTSFGSVECKEIPRGITKALNSTWGPGTSLGGNAGIAFAGRTGWSACASKTPAGGRVVLAFSTHTSMNADGTLGGRTGCAVIEDALQGKKRAEIEMLDVEQSVLDQLINTRRDGIIRSANPGVALAYANFEMSLDYLRRVVSRPGDHAAEIAVVGGITVCMPSPVQDRFVPLVFEVMNCESGAISDLFGRGFPHALSDGWRAEHMIDPSSPRPGDAARVSQRFGDKVGHFFPLVHVEKDWRAAEPTAELAACLRHFPAAQRNGFIESAMFRELSKRGFTVQNTLFAHSTCPDEVNYDEPDTDLVNIMHRRWGEKFTLGGLAGMPFCGQTGWGAFSAHVPVGGRILILYAPHTGIGSEGQVGKLRRDGQGWDSTCCGAACAALACERPGREIRRYDMQQTTLASLLLPHRERVLASEDPQRELVYANFDVLTDYLRRIIRSPEKACVEIAIVGGIMVNLPEPFEDRFVPLVFESLDCKTGQVHDLYDKAFPDVCDPWREEHQPGSPRNTSFQSVARVPEEWHAQAGLFFPLIEQERDFRAKAPTGELKLAVDRFPTIQRNASVDSSVFDALTARGWTAANSKFAVSVCPDEANFEDAETSLVLQMKRRWGDRFDLGGPAGLPLCGRTGWQGVVRQAAGGNLLVLIAPHTGIGADGEIGQLRRELEEHESTCCGAAVAAFASQGAEDHSEYDVHQAVLASQFNKAREQVGADATHLTVNYAAALSYLRNVYNKHTGEAKEIAFLSGIIVNLPEPFEDRFVPLSFECLDTATGSVTDLFDEIGCERDSMARSFFE